MHDLRLHVSSMGCRHCVREVTAWLRDVAGVETVAADAASGQVVLRGTMAAADVLAVFAGSTYAATVLDGAAVPRQNGA